jgi:hypothetical protein
MIIRIFDWFDHKNGYGTAEDFLGDIEQFTKDVTLI